MPGWRFAFFLLGLLSLAVGMLNGIFTKDPRCTRGALRPRSAALGGVGRDVSLQDALSGMRTVLRIPTFLLIVAQVSLARHHALLVLHCQDMDIYIIRLCIVQCGPRLRVLASSRVA